MDKPIDHQLAAMLLARCKAGDKEAFCQLHRLMGRKVYSFAFHRLQRHEDAEDVVSETMYEVWKSAPKFRGDSKVSTWILGIAKYKILEKCRDHPPMASEDIDDHADSLVSDWDDGPAALEKWQTKRLVELCLGVLSAAHRECMQLVYLEGLALAEVAQVLNIPENTVKTRLFHARKDMRRCVEQGHIS